MSHTPEPWWLSPRKSQDDFSTDDIVSADGRRIANCYGGQSEEPFISNARLIAAAPTLLAALERLVDEQPYESNTKTCECGELGNGLDDEGNVCEHIQAHRAIAKAKGK
jgi:hypothetical protein